MPETQRVPEIYADFVQIATSELGIFLGFRAAVPLDITISEDDGSETQAEAPTELKAKVRFSQAGAKTFAMLLRKALKEYEQNYGAIPLPPGFVEQFGPVADEW